MDPKEVVRRLAPHVFNATETGDHWSLAWGMVPHTSGRVFVRKFSCWVCGPSMVEVRLDRAPVWRSKAIAPSGRVESVYPMQIGWLSADEARAERAEERAWNRSRQAERDAAREAVIEAIETGRPVSFEEGQEWGTLTLSAHPVPLAHRQGMAYATFSAVERPACAVSARGVYRTLTGGSAGDEGWENWLAEVTNPPARRHLSRRALACPIQFDLAAG